MKTLTSFATGMAVAVLVVGCDTVKPDMVSAAGSIAAASASKGGAKNAAITAGAVGATAVAASMANQRQEQDPAAAKRQAVAAKRKPSETPEGANSNGAEAGNVKKVATPPPRPQAKPEYTVEQFRQTFAKKTPEQILKYMIGVFKLSNDAREAQGFNMDKMVGALSWSNGFDVINLCVKKDAKKEELEFYYHHHEKMNKAIYTSLSAISDQKELKLAISKLPVNVFLTGVGTDWEQRWGFSDGSDAYTFSMGPFQNKDGDAHYAKVIEKITDPAVADYMFSRNIYLGFLVRELVPKLSKAKKDELYAAAMKRASERKDRIVMEGYYIGMSYLDAKVLDDHYGFNVPLKKGATAPLAAAEIAEDENGHTGFYRAKKLPSEVEVTALLFHNKAWMKFLDCEEDKDALRQLVHQYVKGKQGKAEKYNSSYGITVEGVEAWGRKIAAEVYSSSKLGTKIVFDFTNGDISFLEL